MSLRVLFNIGSVSAARRLGAAFVLAALCVAGGCATNPAPALDNLPPPTAADREFEKGSKRPPTAKTLYTMAHILQTQGKDSEAEFVLRKIIKEHPQFMPAYCDLAETQMRQRRIEDAVGTLNAGLKISPREAILINNVGMCHLMRGEYEIALTHFTQAAALLPDDARYRSNMAVALGMLGRYKESLALYQQVVSAADAHYNLGVLCEARHDNARAAEEYRQAKNLKAVEAKARATGNAPSGASSAAPGPENRTPGSTDGKKDTEPNTEVKADLTPSG